MGNPARDARRQDPVYMVYAQLVYLAAFPDNGGLEDAADFIAKHPENKAFAPN